jgi:hypothetical protein
MLGDMVLYRAEPPTAAGSVYHHHDKGAEATACTEGLPFEKEVELSCPCCPWDKTSGTCQSAPAHAHEQAMELPGESSPWGKLLAKVLEEHESEYQPASCLRITSGHVAFTQCVC